MQRCARKTDLRYVLLAVSGQSVLGGAVGGRMFSACSSQHRHALKTAFGEEAVAMAQHLFA